MNKKKKEGKNPRRYVFYSVTTDNPFLPSYYIDSLLEDLDEKMAQRMIYGKWIEINDETLYYAYSSETNFVNVDYKPDPKYPVYIGFDFNIGDGKPLSSCVMQYIDDKIHIYGEAVVDGLRTTENCQTLADKGYLDLPTKYYVCGDASGKHRDTRNNRSDYDLIKSFFAHYIRPGGGLIDFEMKIPVSNPPIRKRHNLVNAYCRNAKGDQRLTVYKGAPTADKGLRLTKLKKGSMIEDDSKRYQHITTAIGYTLHMIQVQRNKREQSTIQL